MRRRLSCNSIESVLPVINRQSGTNCNSICDYAKLTAGAYFCMTSAEAVTHQTTKSSLLIAQSLTYCLRHAGSSPPMQLNSATFIPKEQYQNLEIVSHAKIKFALEHSQNRGQTPEEPCSEALRESWDDGRQVDFVASIYILTVQQALCKLWRGLELHCCSFQCLK